MTFWDFCAPFYDAAEKVNGTAYEEMLKVVESLTPKNTTVLDTAAGTGAISIAASQNASHVICTDISEKMLSIARKKIKKRNIQNITIKNQSIYNLSAKDESYDIVIAGQVLHIIDSPEKAASELKRVTKQKILLPMSFTKNLRGSAKLGVNIYRLFGFAPKIELAPDTYENFLTNIGFDDCEIIQIAGKIPMAVAVWKKCPNT